MPWSAPATPSTPLRDGVERLKFDFHTQVPTLTNDVDEVIAVLGPKEELDFEDFCLALARVGLAHGAGRVAGEPDPIRALLVVIASSDGFAQAQRTPSRKSLRDFSPPSPMAALQL